MTKVLYPSWLPGGGFTLCQHLILINARYRDDHALLQHELTHVAQMQRAGTLIWWWNYLTSKSFRQTAEVEAYQVQIKNGTSVAFCADCLQRMYWLGITLEQATSLLEATK